MISIGMTGGNYGPSFEKYSDDRSASGVAGMRSTSELVRAIMGTEMMRMGSWKSLRGLLRQRCGPKLPRSGSG